MEMIFNIDLRANRLWSTMIIPSNKCSYKPLIIRIVIDWHISDGLGD
jgi:hypothetical protein